MWDFYIFSMSATYQLGYIILLIILLTVIMTTDKKQWIKQETILTNK